MKKIVAPAIAVLIALAVISVASMAFTTNERQVIRLLKQRIAALEVSQVETASDIEFLYTDIDILGTNQVANDSSIRIIDEGLKSIVAPDGPMATIDRRLADLQKIVWAAHPPIAISGIEPTIACGTTTCTATIDWDVSPPATGQVEWGETTAYGNKTALETELLSHHRQVIRDLPLDRDYHFRVLATTPEAQAASPDVG